VNVLWIFCLQFFVAEQVARSAWILPYSFATNYISDLGRTGCGPLVCSPWHAVMNLSFVIQGLLIAGGAAVEMRRSHGLMRLGLAILVLCGGGVFMVGMVPSDENAVWHQIGAAMHFLAGGLGIITVGLGLRGMVRWTSVSLGIIILTATVLLGQHSSSVVNAVGAGTVERTAAYAITLWMTAMGLSRTARSVSPCRLTGTT
jgi:hypothetical membrane protein